MEHLGTSDAVETYWNAALPHLQAHYCHSTLGTKIHIERIGSIKHYEGKRLTATGANLDKMSGSTAEDIGTADLIVYMCHDAIRNQCNSCEVTYGISETGSVCQPGEEARGRKLNIVEWTEPAAKFGWVRQFTALTCFFPFSRLI